MSSGVTTTMPSGMFCSAMVRVIARALPCSPLNRNSRGEAFGQFVEGDCHYEQHSTVERCASRMSLFFFNTREVVQMRRKAVEQAYQGYTRRHSGYYLPPLARSAHGGGGSIRHTYCRREHHARAEAEKHIIPFVWYPSYGKSYNRACERRQAGSRPPRIL